MHFWMVELQYLMLEWNGIMKKKNTNRKFSVNLLRRKCPGLSVRWEAWRGHSNSVWSPTASQADWLLLGPPHCHSSSHRRHWITGWAHQTYIINCSLSHTNLTLKEMKTLHKLVYRRVLSVSVALEDFVYNLSEYKQSVYHSPPALIPQFPKLTSLKWRYF